MKVRIKKSPITGSQRDYSLVTHRIWSPSNTDVDEPKNTIGAVPRSQANIEAEGGETILGDINNDGNIEHMTITGKRHTQGGVPLNVPPGSFIFSDTKKMKIKDQAVLDHFGMGSKKGGYTPAEIAKRYQLNDFMKKVNDPSTDSFTRRTAERMLNNNMQKLSELAAYQEGMKGKQAPAVSQQMLPDGGQKFNETAQPQMDPSQMDPQMMQQMMMQQQEEQGEPQGMPEQDELEMAYGGMIRMQQGGSPLIVPGYQFYIGSQKAKIKSVDNNLVFDDYVHLEKPVNGISKIPLKDFKKHFNSYNQYNFQTNISDETPMLSDNPFATRKYYNTSSVVFGSNPMPDLNYNSLDVGQVGLIKPGMEFVTKNDKFKVINPKIQNSKGEWVIKVKDSKGLTNFLTPDELREFKKNNELGVIGKDGNVVSFGQQNNPSSSENGQIGLSGMNGDQELPPKATGSASQFRTVYTPEGKAIQYPKNSSAPPGYMEEDYFRAHFGGKAKSSSSGSNLGGTPKSLPKQASKVKVYDNVDDLYNDKWQELQDHAMGGQLYAEGGTTEVPKYKYDPALRRMVPVMQTAGTVPGDEKEFVEEYDVKGIGKHKRITKGNKITIVGPDGKVVKEGNIENNYNTYSKNAIDDWKKNNIDVTLPEELNDSYGNDETEGRQGIRTDVKGVYGTKNYWDDKRSADFKKRQERFISANPNFDPEKDSGGFQSWYNKDIYDQSRAAGYNHEEALGHQRQFGFQEGSLDPNAMDSKFGRYTWSRPTIKIGKKPPGPITVYRCPDCQPVQVPGDYKMAAGDYDSQAYCKSMCAEKSTPPPGKNPPDNDFWIQNKLGIANAALMDRFYGEPAMFQMNGSLYDPQLEEYSAKNAALQSDASMAMSNINASADPTTARANIAAIAGQLGQTGVNQIADIQNRNVQTTNAVAADRARLKNDFIGKNTAARKQFYDETMNYGQNLVNSSNKQRTMMTNAFNNAFQGLQNRNMMRAIYPMYDINSVTGAHAFIDGQDFTEGGYRTKADETSGGLPALIQQYKEQLKGSLSPENAEKQAIYLANKHLEASNQSKLANQRAYLQNNPQAAMAGMTGGYNPFE